MKAMIFAAGLGTRLQPITDSIPKALVRVGGKPALQHVIEHVKLLGIKDIIVNVHHFPEQICQFLEENEQFGVNIAISDESSLLLDTGGGLLKALPLLGDDQPVLLHNADVWTDAPLDKMIQAHLASESDATLLAWDRPTSRKLLFDACGVMQGWVNLFTGETRPDNCDLSQFNALGFGGIHIINPSLFQALKEYGQKKGDVFSMTPFYIEVCRSALIRYFTPSQQVHWFDIGRSESLNMASEYVRSLK